MFKRERELENDIPANIQLLFTKENCPRVTCTPKVKSGTVVPDTA